MLSKRLWFFVKMMAVTAAACMIVTAGYASEKPISVIVSIPPQAFFVKSVAGDRVSVDVLLPAGESPATFTPEPSRITRLAAADIYFRIGVPFENMVMPSIGTIDSGIRVVDTRKNISLRTMHSAHGHDGQQKQGKDPHIWLDPLLVKQQTLTIRNALCEADPAGCSVYETNTDEFVKALTGLHQTLESVLAPIRGEQIFVFHPAFGYFADAYGLEQVAVEMEGKAPKGRQLLGFIKKARKAGVRVVFVQSQFDRRAAGKIAEAIDGAVVPLDPLARDYMANMRQMAEAIKNALAHSITEGRTDVQ
ncbi:MAG: zinc ABC transporter substrate-binding protein [Thermodesulfobacteriota bacterium]|nr:zinc ABC transporter substrate-binding protein [Thermodesulfobacteriota bacterium]